MQAAGGQWHAPSATGRGRAAPAASPARPCTRVRSTAPRAAAPQQGQGQELITMEELQAAAWARGMSLSLRELGPFYRIVCREGNEEGPILALTTGFVAPPFRLMHCDTLQVFTSRRRGSEGERVRGGVLGLGLLVGGATFCHGLSRGCTRAEILAINDDDDGHARLVKYYSYFGFEPVAEVGGGEITDLPHMLVWGGAGTRMDADVRRMLAKWTPALRRRALEAAPAAHRGDDLASKAVQKGPLL